jgi:hypothetical protein
VALRAVVVGGGTAAAVALARAGIDVRVYEQARQLAEVGAGVSLAPNGLRMLERLGVGDGIERLGARHASTQLRLSNGQPARHQPHEFAQARTQHGHPPGRPARAATLLAACAGSAGVPVALAAYEELRRDRTGARPVRLAPQRRRIRQLRPPADRPAMDLRLRRAGRGRRAHRGRAARRSRAVTRRPGRVPPAADSSKRNVGDPR